MERILSMALRIGELAFAATVAGLTGAYLHSVRHASAWTHKRFIYTEVVAGLSMLLALLWVLPFAGGFIHWPVDMALFIMWIVSFGLLVNFIGPLHCGSVFHWGDITDKGTCQRWKADVAFTFLGAIFWLVSALLGIYFVYKRRRAGAIVDGTAAGTRRNRWYRRSQV